MQVIFSVSMYYVISNYNVYINLTTLYILYPSIKKFGTRIELVNLRF